MSSDDGIDYHKTHQQSQQTITTIPPSNISSSTSSSNASNTLRRKSLTQAHFQHHHQLQAQAININCGGSGLSKERDRDRIDVCDRSCNDIGTITNQLGGCGGGGRDGSYVTSNASPIRFIQQDENGYHTIGTGRLSACSSDRYDENITCCLPPPSPAPTSDRFVIGIPSPSTPHYQDHRFSVHQTRTMSPNSRFRTISTTDRYRDMSPKCDRFPSHYLANSTPLASTENYAYLNSIVHTPVKRYIPTPPPPSNDTYSDSGSYHSSRSHPSNTIPYRLRLKCCDQPPPSVPPQHVQNSMINDPNMADHYATPPRGRPIKCNSNSSISAGSQTGGTQGTQTMSRSRCSADMNDYNSMPRTPSVEYLQQGGRVATPVSVLSEPNSVSCLHCNTLRRATGVHQTTQTTGPISPVPISSGSNHDFVSSQSTNQPPPPPPIVSPPSPIPSTSVSLPSLQQQPPPPPSPEQPIPSIQSQEPSPRPQRKESNPTITYTAPRQNYDAPPSSLPIPSTLNRPTSQPPPTQHQIMIQSQTHSNQSQLQAQQQQNRHPPLVRLSRKQKVKEYIRRQFTQFFGIDEQSEEFEKNKWMERQKRFAIRQFGQLSTATETNTNSNINQNGERPDILPAQINDDHLRTRNNNNEDEIIPKKLSVPKMVWNGCSYVVQTLSKKRNRKPTQWSRSFAPHHITANDDGGDLCDGLSPLQEDEVFFDSPNTPSRQTVQNGNGGANGGGGVNPMLETRQMYMPERVQGWRTRSTELQMISGQGQGYRGTRIASQLIDGVLDNSRRSIQHKIKLLRSNELDDRNDYRPVFTYWINTVQILVLILSIICYGIGPIGIGYEQRSSQVLVTSLSLQQVHHMEQRNVWIGLRGSDLVHLGAKFATCMRRDGRTLDVITRTRRNERETACCIRNDDSGCVQSSQADCSVSILSKNRHTHNFNIQKFIPKVRGLWPTVSHKFVKINFMFNDISFNSLSQYQRGRNGHQVILAQVGGYPVLFVD